MCVHIRNRISRGIRDCPPKRSSFLAILIRCVMIRPPRRILRYSYILCFVTVLSAGVSRHPLHLTFRPRIIRLIKPKSLSPLSLSLTLFYLVYRDIFASIPLNFESLLQNQTMSQWKKQFWQKIMKKFCFSWRFTLF